MTGARGRESVRRFFFLGNETHCITVETITTGSCAAMRANLRALQKLAQKPSESCGR